LPTQRRQSPNLDLYASVLNSSPRTPGDTRYEEEEEEEEEEVQEFEDEEPEWWLEWSVFVGKDWVHDEVLNGCKFNEYQDVIVTRSFEAAKKTLSSNQPVVHVKLCAKGMKPICQTYHWRDTQMKYRTARHLRD
jgi:hypothetical protein